jgi:predicted SnoaL-like aldol condensation-catalyzing enzyme
LIGSPVDAGDPAAIREEGDAMHSMRMSGGVLAVALIAACATAQAQRGAAPISLAPPPGPIVEGQAVPVTVAVDQQALLASPDPRLAANKKLVFDWWREVLAAGHVANADKYMHADYIQHNPAVATGAAAFKAFFGSRPPREIKLTIDNLVSIVAEGDMVIFAFKRDLPDPQDSTKCYTTTWFDMMRIKDGKVAEHWDYGTKRPASAPPPQPAASAPPLPCLPR